VLAVCSDWQNGWMRNSIINSQLIVSFWARIYWHFWQAEILYFFRKNAQQNKSRNVRLCLFIYLFCISAFVLLAVGHCIFGMCRIGSGSRSPPRALWMLARGNPHAHGTTHVPGGEGGYEEVNPFIISPQTMKSCEHFAHMWDIVGRRFHHSAGVSLGLSPPSHPNRSQSFLV